MKNQNLNLRKLKMNKKKNHANLNYKLNINKILMKEKTQNNSLDIFQINHKSKLNLISFKSWKSVMMDFVLNLSTIPLLTYKIKEYIRKFSFIWTIFINWDINIIGWQCYIATIGFWKICIFFFLNNSHIVIKFS